MTRQTVEILDTWGVPHTPGRDYVYRRVRITTVVEQDERECLTCGEWLPFDRFGMSKGRPRAHCQRCRYNNEGHDRREYRRWNTRRWNAENDPAVQVVDCTFDEWLEILATTGRRCRHCGLEGADEMDAIVPHTLGGPFSASNLAPAHSRCPNQPRPRETWVADARPGR